MNKYLLGRQFRAPRSKNGKLIKNRKGNNYKSRHSYDYDLDDSRRRRLNRQSIKRETFKALVAGLDEAVVEHHELMMSLLRFGDPIVSAATATAISTMEKFLRYI